MNNNPSLRGPQETPLAPEHLLERKKLNSGTKYNFRMLFKTLMTINLNINQTLILLRADGNVYIKSSSMIINV